MGQGDEVTRYRVIVVGMGKRGLHHAAAFASNPRFELAGISSRDSQKLAAAASKLPNVRATSDPVALAKEVKPLGIKTIGGYRTGDKWDHPKGLALDFMTFSGQGLADFAVAIVRGTFESGEARQTARATWVLTKDGGQWRCRAF